MWQGLTIDAAAGATKYNTKAACVLFRNEHCRDDDCISKQRVCMVYMYVKNACYASIQRGARKKMRPPAWDKLCNNGLLHEEQEISPECMPLFSCWAVFS